MKKLYQTLKKSITKFILFSTLAGFVCHSQLSVACNNSTSTFVSSVNNGDGTFTITINVCVALGIAPGFQNANTGTNSFTFTPAGGSFTTIASLTTTNYVSTYNYCDAGADPCSKVMGSPVCTGSVLVGGGNGVGVNGGTSATFTGSGLAGQWLAPPSENFCDATNPANFCQDITFTTNGSPATVTLTGMEGGACDGDGSQVISIPAPVCGPTGYCASNATSTADSECDRVILNTLDNNTAGVCADYSNFTCLAATDLTQGVSYPLTVITGSCGGCFAKYTNVFIDWNQNGVFTDAGEKVLSQPSTTCPETETATVVVPLTAVLGNTRMRVVVREAGSDGTTTPCGTYTWGETEDYVVNVISAGPTCSDGILNQSETCIDCGGPCVACCTNGVLNADAPCSETGIDCGGSCGGDCCANGFQDVGLGETGVDCGGPCPACIGSCSDGIMNQDECLIDCGGVCPACPPFQDPADVTFNQHNGAPQTGFACTGTIYDDGGPTGNYSSTTYCCPPNGAIADGWKIGDGTPGFIKVCFTYIDIEAGLCMGFPTAYIRLDIGDGTAPQSPTITASSNMDTANGDPELCITVDLATGYSWVNINNTSCYGGTGGGFAAYWTTVDGAGVNQCLLATCCDGIQNQDETGIDCGGTTCDPCIFPCPACSNGVQDCSETGIDCGGTCIACHCLNGIQDFDEAGIDCGGIDCSACSCIANQTCGTAQPISLFGAGDTVSNCFTGCNTGANDDPHTVIAGGCPTVDAFQSVWFSVTATNSVLDIIVNNAAFPPQISVWTSACNAIYSPCWVQGTADSASILNFTVRSGTTYKIEISSTTDGLEGDFDLCILDYVDPSECNTAGGFVVTPPPDSNGVHALGYWPPGTVVNFCYTIDPFNKISCNWLHSIIPAFGAGWEPFNPATDITTALIVAGNDGGSWSWFAAGAATFDNGGCLSTGPAPAGWYYEPAASSDGNPSNNAGDGLCSPPAACDCDVAGGGLTWTVCFNLTAKPIAACTVGEDLSLNMRTFGDGETGNYGTCACQTDLPDPDVYGTPWASCDTTPPGLFGSNVIDSTTIVDQIGKVKFDVLFTEPIVCGTVQGSGADFELGTNGMALTLGYLGGVTGTLAVITNAEPLTCHDPIARLMTDIPKDTTRWVRITLNIDSMPLNYDTTWYVRSNSAGFPTVTLRDAGGNLFIDAGGAIVKASVALPVELLYFTGYIKGTNVILEWATASEENNDYFSIQRSKDGKYFKTIGTVDGAGTSNEVIEYLFVDKKPFKGVNYYRLKQTDYDGQESFSEIIKVNVNTEVFEIVDIYPVPAEGTVVVTFNSNSKDFVNLSIFDIAGKESISDKYYAYVGFNSVSVKVSDLAKGVYFLHLEKNGERVYTKMLKD